MPAPRKMPTRRNLPSTIPTSVSPRKRGSNTWTTRPSARVTQTSRGRLVVMKSLLRTGTTAVQAEILSRRTPLGRILIEHNVLRRIEPTAYLRVVPGPAMMEWFGLAAPAPIYGRLALIHCDGKAAVELLEIVAPE